MARAATIIALNLLFFSLLALHFQHTEGGLTYAKAIAGGGGCSQGYTGQSVTLSCPANQVILDIDGIYKQYLSAPGGSLVGTNWTCANYPGSNLSMTLNCQTQVPSFWVLMVQQCQLRQSCIVPVSNALFDSTYFSLTDRYPTCANDTKTPMQLVALWTCGPQQYVTTISPDSISRCVTISETYTVTISCSDLPNSKITASFFANYGVPSQCPISNSPDNNGAFLSLCPYTQNSLLNTTLKNCLGQQSCSVTASNDVLKNDPCQNVVKDIVIVYGCFVNGLIVAVPIFITATSNFTANVGVYLQTLPAAPVNVTLLGGVGGSYYTVPAYLTFAPSTYNVMQNFTIYLYNNFPFPSNLSLNGSSTDATYNQASTIITINGTSLCPNNPRKNSPGVCGCNTLDTDTDGDGTPDCIDQCPTDPMKIVLGLCGCFVNDNNYLGWNSACTTTMQCCDSGGYIGGTVAWNQLAGTQADIIQFSWVGNFDLYQFCATVGSTSFNLCSTMAPPSNKTYTQATLSGLSSTLTFPSVGSVVPGMYINYGVSCPSTSNCSSLSSSQTVDITSYVDWTYANSSTAYNGGYLYISPPKAGQSVVFTVPTGLSGTLFIQTYSNKPSSNLFTPSQLMYTVKYNGGANTAVVYFTPTGNGWRVLGSWAFIGTASETVTISVVTTGSGYIALADAIQFTTFDPTCDVLTTPVATAGSGVSAYFYLPANSMARFDASITGACPSGYLTLYTNTNADASSTTYTGADNYTPRGTGVTGASVYISGGVQGANVALYALLNVGNNCNVVIKRSILIPSTVTYVHNVENYIVTQATSTFYYPPQSCLVGTRTAFVASFESIGRDRGSNQYTAPSPVTYKQEISTSYRVQTTIYPPFVSLPNNNRAAAAALPAMMRVVNGVNLPFLVWGGSSLANDVLSLGTSDGFSARQYSPSLLLANPYPTATTITGSATSFLSLNFSSTLSVDYYSVTSTVKDSNNIMPFDMVLRILTAVSNNRNPTLSFKLTSPLLVNCPASLNVTASDPDTTDTVNFEWLPWPVGWASPWNMPTISVTSSSVRTLQFSFVPQETTPISLMFGAYDLRNGSVYAYTTLSPANPSCPSFNGVLCNAPYGTCLCNNTCACLFRWSGSACSTYANSPPVMNVTSFAIDENSINVPYQLQAYDPDGDGVTFTMISSSNFMGTITMTPNGLLSLTPTLYHYTTTTPDSILVTVTDNGTIPKSNTYTINITVKKIYIRPSVPGIAVTVFENCATQSYQLSAVNPNSYTLSYTLAGSATLGTITGFNSATGSFQYTCTYALSGLDSIPFFVSDGQNYGDTYAYINITVSYVHLPPTATGFNFSTREDTPYTGQLQGSDIDGAGVNYVVVSGPAVGVLNITLATTGVFTYTPQPYAPGIYAFTFKLVEISAPPTHPNVTLFSSTPATVYINVSQVVHSPVANAMSFNILENQQIQSSLDAYSLDPGVPVTFAVVTGSLSPSASGTSTLTNGPSSPAFSFIPTANYYGVVTFNYSVSNGIKPAVTNVVTVIIADVNVAPTFTLTPVTVNENTGPGTTQLWSNLNLGPYPESVRQSILSQTVQVTAAWPSNIFASAPTLSSTGVLTYSITPNVYGNATLLVTVQDNGGTANGGNDTTSATTTFTVAYVNQAPSFVFSNPPATLEDTSGQVAYTFASSISAGPASENWQTVQFVPNVLACTTPLATLFASAPTFSSSGVVTFTLNPLQFGNCTYSIVLQDNGGTTNGGIDVSASRTLAIIITQVHHAPSFVPLTTTWTVLETPVATLQSLPYASSVSEGAPNESDPMSFIISETGFAGYFASLKDMFAIAPAVSPATASVTGLLSATIAPYANGNVTISTVLGKTTLNPPLYSSTSVLSLFITPVNDAPQFILSQSTLTYNEGDVVSPITIATSVQAGPSGAIDELATQTIAFSVTHDCEPTLPLFATQPFVSISGSTGTLSFSLNSYGSTSALAGGSCTLTITVEDNGGIANGGINTFSQNVKLTVNFVNQPPTFTAGAAIQMNEDPDANISYSATWATNVIPGPLPFEANQAPSLIFLLTPLSTTGDLKFFAAPKLTISGTNGLLTFIVAKLTSGSATFSVVLQDGYGGSNTSVTAQLAITVSAVDTPITFDVYSPLTVNETASPSLVSYPFASAIYNINASTPGLASSTSGSVTVISGESLLNGVPTIANIHGFDTFGASGEATITFTPAQYAFGTVTAQVVLSSSASSSSKQFTIVINNVNQPPTFNVPKTSFTYPEDTGATTISGFVTSISAGAGNEGALLGQTVSFIVLCDNTQLFLVQPSVSASGTLTFTSAVSTVGVAQCTIQGVDTGSPPAYSSTVPFTINYTFWNHNPSFVAGSTTTVLENSGPALISAWASLIIPGPPNEYSQSLQFTLTPTNPSLFADQPTLTLDALPPNYPTTASLAFTPVINQYGTTAVSIALVDSLNASATPVQTFSIVITFVNQPPIFNLSTATIILPEYSGAQIISNFIPYAVPGPSNVAENAQTLTWTVTSSDNSLFANSSDGVPQLSIHGGDLYFTLASGVYGTATITVTAQDNGGTANGGNNSTSISIPMTVNFVNKPPYFSCGTSSITVLENSNTAVISGWASGISPGDPSEVGVQSVAFNVTVTQGSPSVLTPSSVTVSNTTGSLSFSLVPLVFGAATIDVQTCDSLGLCSTSICTLVVTVQQVNQQPFFTLNNNTVQVLENSGTTVLANVFTGMSPGNGLDESLQTIGFIVSIVASNPSNLLVSTPVVDVSSGSLTVTPTTNLNGTVVLSVVLKDNGGTSNGGIDTSTASQVTVTVLWVNQAPTLTIIQSSVTVNEYSGSNTITGLFNNISPGPANENWQTVAFTMGTIAYSNVMAKYSSGALFVTLPTISPTGTLSFTLANGAYGVASIPFQLMDNGGTANNGVNATPVTPATLTITVNRVAIPPVANNDSVQTNENTIATFNVLANDFSDWDFDFGSSTLKVDHVLSTLTTRGGTVAVVNGGMAISYSPPDNYFGMDTFEYIATDGSCSASQAACFSAPATVAVTVNHVYIAPTAFPSSFTVVENQVYTATASSLFSATDANIDDPITFALSSQPSHGMASLVGDTFTYTPTMYYCGMDSLTYTASVSTTAVSAPAVVTVSVTCIDIPPIAQNLSTTMPQNTLSQQNSVSLPLNVTDYNAWDQGQLVYSCNSGFRFGAYTPALNTVNSISVPIVYNPNLYKSGVDVMFCTVTTVHGLTTSFTATVTVIGPAHNPPIILQPLLQLTGYEDVAGGGQLQAIDYDGNPMTYIFTSPPPPGICSVTVNQNNGTFTYISALHQFGMCSFNWTVYDAYNYATTIGVVQINILPVVHAPVALNSTITLNENTIATNQILQATNIDVNQGTTLIFYLLSQPSNGVVTLTSTTAGTFTYTPPNLFYGNTSFTFGVNSSVGLMSNTGTVTVVVTFVDQPPIAYPTTVTTREDIPISITLPYSDVDTPLSGETFAISQQPAHGTANIVSGQTALYTPALHYYGVDTFQFSVNDGTYTAYAIVTVNVTFYNYPPTAQNATWTVSANVPLTQALQYSDIQYPVNNLTLTIVTPPTMGSLQLNNTIQKNLVTYVPLASSNPSYTASDMFAYKVSDPYGSVSNVAYVAISIKQSPFMRPLANSNTFNIVMGQTLSSSLTGSDPNNVTFTFAIVSNPIRGQLTLTSAATGAFSYVPNYNFFGLDSFVFITQDQYFSSLYATVTLNVTYVPKVPVVYSMSIVTNENIAVVGQFNATDSDPVRTIQSFSIVSPPAKGLVTNLTTSGAFVYTPALNFFGTDSFIYAAYDGYAYSNQGMITVTVRHVFQPPVAISATYSINRNTSLSGTLTATDPDIPYFNVVLSYYVVPGAIVTQGAVTADPTTGSFVYTPPTMFYGTTSFYFVAVANGNINSINTAQVSITVIYQAFVPSANPMTATTKENIGTSIKLSGSDLDNLALTYSLPSSSTTSGGTVSLQGNTALYTPAPFFVGTDTFTFRVNNGYLTSAPAMVTVIVTRVPVPPIVSNGIYSVIVGDSLAVTVRATDADPSATLQLTGLSDTMYGTAQVLPDPPLTFNYVSGNASGVEVITVTVTTNYGDSSTGTITIYILDAQVPAPTVGALSFFGTENTPVLGTLSVLISYAPIASFIAFNLQPTYGTFTSDQATLNTGAFTIQPATNVFGAFTFQYQAVDVNGGVSNVGTVTISLAKVNYPPQAVAKTVATNQGTPVTFTLEATDPDGLTTLTFLVSSRGNLQPNSLVLDASTGVTTVTPSASFVGTLTFYFTVFDSVLTSSPAAVNIIVQPVDHPPVAYNTSMSGPETAISIIGQLSGSDVDGQGFTFSITTPTNDLPGTLTYDNSRGVVTFVPNGLGYGTYVLTYVVINTLTSNPAYITLTVSKVNKPPVAYDQPFTVNENSLSNAGQCSAIDLDSGFTYSVLSSTANGKLMFSDDGVFDYVPNTNYAGSDSFTFVATDYGGLVSNVATVSITILPVSTPPTAISQSIVLNEGSSYTGAFTGTSIVPHTKEFLINVPPSYGTLVLNDTASGNFTYTPNYLFYGTDFALFSLRDSIAISSVAVLSIQVNHVPHAPTAKNFSITVTAGVPAHAAFQGSDVDVGDVLRYSVFTEHTTGSVTVQGQQFTYLFTGPNTTTQDTFSYIAIDSTNLQSNVAHVSVAILAAPPSQGGTGSTSTAAENSAGANIAGGAIGAVFAVLAIFAIIYGIWRYRQLGEVKKYENAIKSSQFATEQNPLYASRFQEMYNPLFTPNQHEEDEEHYDPRDTFVPFETGTYHNPLHTSE